MPVPPKDPNPNPSKSGDPLRGQDWNDLLDLIPAWDPTKNFVLFDDFTGAAEGESNWTLYNIGTVARSAQAVAGRIGVRQLQTAAVAGNLGGLGRNLSFDMALSGYDITFALKYLDLANVIATIGFSDTPAFDQSTGTSIPNGIYFLYSVPFGTVGFEGIAQKDGVNFTEALLSITPDTNWHIYRLVKKSSACDFYYDGVLKGSLTDTSFWPTGAGFTPFATVQQDTTSAVAHRVQFDWAILKNIGGLSR